MTLNMGDFINKFRSQKVPVAVKKVPDSGGQITEFLSDKDLSGEFDAVVWAREFVRHVNRKAFIATNEEVMVGWFANAIMAGYDQAKKEEKYPSEYLFAFVAWLTGREEVLTIGASEDCSVWAKAVGTFCEENNLAMPREHYADYIVYPKEIK